MKTQYRPIASPCRWARFVSNIAVFAASVVIFGVVQSRAAVLSWSGTGPGGNWSLIDNWGSAGVPASGDTLIFTVPQPNQITTNDIPGLVLNQIKFIGASGGYIIRGNSFTVTNGIFATNKAGANAITNAITFAPPNVTVFVNSNASLALGGVLSGTSGLTKTGLGTLSFSGSGANTYTGPTVVNGGQLQLSKASVIDGGIAAGGSLSISNATVNELLNNQLGAMPITINLGYLELSGVSDTISNSLTLINGGEVDTGAGTLTLTANPTITVSNSVSYITGNLNIGSGTCSIQGDGALSLSANVAGSADIVKGGANTLALYGVNTYTGTTTVNSGLLYAESNQALGATNAGTVINGTAEFWLIDAHITNETLTLNSTTPNGALQDSLTGDWTGPIILSTNVYIEASSALGIDGPISGPGGFTKISPDVLTLKGSTANTYAGATIVNSGTLVLGKSSFVTAIPGNLVISSNCTVALTNYVQTSDAADILVNAGG